MYVVEWKLRRDATIYTKECIFISSVLQEVSGRLGNPGTEWVKSYWREKSSVENKQENNKLSN